MGMNQLFRHFRVALMLAAGVLLVAACTGSGESPTATPGVVVLPTSSNTPDPSAEPTVISPFGTLPPARTDAPIIGPSPEFTGVDDGAQPGGRGTLVAVGTVDPSLPAGFDKIIVIRTGGPTDDQGRTLDETVVIERSGAMTRNGAPGTASPSSVERIGTMIDAVNIFAVQANFIGPVPQQGPVPYMYQLLVVKGFSERLITAQDGLIPAEIESIITAVLSEGFQIDRP